MADGPDGKGSSSQADFRRLRTTIARVSKLEAKRGARLDAICAFDADWYRKANPGAEVACSSGATASLADYFLTRDLPRSRPVSPYFSEGLGRAYADLAGDDATTLDDVIAALRSAAMEGVVGSWLFNADFFRSQARRGALAHQGQPLGGSGGYMDFLLGLTGPTLSPHPLFSLAAYRMLNDWEGDAAHMAFTHYLSCGCFSEFRTSALFDPDFYLSFNPHVRLALMEGRYTSALHHFLSEGVLSDLPFSPDFDGDFYRRDNPEISASVAKGEIPSMSWHYLFQGAGEGRACSPYFDPTYYRARYPDAQAEMRRLGIGSDLEHFLLIGRARGYKGGEPLVTRKPDLTEAKGVFQRRARRSLSKLQARPLDFRPFRSAAPEVSIVIPVCNEIEFTSRAVECAYYACGHLLQSQGVTSEVILVDNGSTDGTAALFATCQGLVQMRFDEPLGFPRAVNAGVAAASGAYLIIANNDIAFEPDTFANARARLVADGAVGVVGGLTILPNETLQEAGSYLESGGGVVGAGRGENPWDIYFSGVHPADYCTGSLIAFRRADFDALGGFDPEFSPGYYEETDFCFRMRRDLGKSCVVDSSIQLTHFEHASFGKGRPPAVAHALIQRNRDRFVARNQEAVARLPSASALITPLGPRPQAIGRARILFIEDLIPDARLGSGFPRVAQIVKALTRRNIGCEILALRPSEVVDEFQDGRVTLHRGWMPGGDPEAFLRREAGRFSHIVVCRAHNLAQYGPLLESLRHQHGLTLVCDTEALSITRVLEQRRLLGGAVSDAEVVEAVRLEFASPARISRWIAVTGYDKGLLEASGARGVSVIGHSHDPRPGAPTPRPWAERTRLITVGAMHEVGAPNHDGLLWFLDRVYPRCGEAARGLTLTAVGYWSPQVLAAMARRAGAVHHLGVVSDERIAALYDESRIAIAPTRFAAGMPLKATEAMCGGVPIVMTDLLERQLSGVGPVGGSGLAVGRRDDDGESFARWVDRLALDEAAWTAVRDRQYAVASPHVGQEAFEAAVDGFLAAVGITA